MTRGARLARAALVALLAAPLARRSGSAQVPADLAQERADLAAWLAQAPTSPLAAVAQQPIGAGIRLGPSDADIPMPGTSEHRVRERDGAVRLDGPGTGRVLPRGVQVRLGAYTVVAQGPSGRALLMVFGPRRRAIIPRYFEYRPELVVTGKLLPPAHRVGATVLGPDGVEVEAVEMGTFEAALPGGPVRLRVLRLAGAGEESDPEIFFRDGTSGHGSYPAGRFVALEPTAGGRYRVDFNRARNPFCAYNSVYACPAPWAGNTLAAPIAAGERYEPAR